MILSIIIPVFNEEKTIAELLKRVNRARLPKNVSREIVIVDDASSDSSKLYIQKLKSKIGGMKLLEHRRNRGKGAAIRTGLAKARGDVILIQDADLEYDPNDYSKLLAPVLAKKASVVYGSRLRHYPVRLSGRKKTPFLMHYLGNKFLTLITNFLYGNGVTDMETCYKLISREVLSSFKLESNRFEFEPEITAKILRAGYKIYEVPIKVNPRGYEEGKKITWKDGFSAVWTLIKYRITE